MKNRKQKAVINNKTSLSEVVLAGVPQGYIDRPLLFNLLINDQLLSASLDVLFYNMQRLLNAEVATGGVL